MARILNHVIPRRVKDVVVAYSPWTDFLRSVDYGVRVDVGKGSKRISLLETEEPVVVFRRKVPEWGPGVTIGRKVSFG